MHLLIIMRFLVGCRREKYLCSSPLSTATPLRNRLDDLILDKLLTHLIFLSAICDQVFYVSRSLIFRIVHPVVESS